MRLPKSSNVPSEALKASMKCWVAGHSTLPTGLDDLPPRTSQDPGGTGMSLARLPIARFGPCVSLRPRGIDRGHGGALGRRPGQH
jgi:hypothetical protein